MARLRMIVLYDQSEAFHGLVVGTGNKTEILLGYTTLFGDSACAINPHRRPVQDPGAPAGRRPGRARAASSTSRPSADLWSRADR